MPAASFSNTMTRNPLQGASAASAATIDRLTKLASRGLVPMFDSRKQVFCYAMKRVEGKVVYEGVSRRYTLMCLLGFHRLESAGGTSPLPIAPMLEPLLTNFQWIDNVGDLGLVLWACAILAPDRLDQVAKELELDTALTRFNESGKNISVHLGWFLTGMSYAKLHGSRSFGAFDLVAREAYKRLCDNQGPRGIFGFHATTYGIAGINRGRIGCFADQVYPIYAFSRYSQAYGDSNAAQKAQACGDRICEAQGSLGQWWWHYDSATGNVIGRFPVFSVHQHAMAPMCLQVLGEATGRDYSQHIFKGVDWIHSNELKFNMEDSTDNVVWRCISPSKTTRALRVGKNLMLGREDSENNEGLSVLYECRPYELGWMLYAFADAGRK